MTSQENVQLLRETFSAYNAGFLTGDTSAFVDTDMLLYELVTIRDGKLVQRRPFRDRAEALEAAGLSRQDAHADA
jgi:hypothetical protein